MDSETVEADTPSRKVLQEVVKMENSDYSATPYIVNLDVVGPLTVYVQVGGNYKDYKFKRTF